MDNARGDCSDYYKRRLLSPEDVRELKGLLFFVIDKCELDVFYQLTDPITEDNLRLDTDTEIMLLGKVIAARGKEEFYPTSLKKMLEFLIKNSMPGIVNFSAKYANDVNVKMTALHFAVQNGNAEAVKILLSRGADPSICDCLGNPITFYLNSIKSDEVKEHVSSTLACFPSNLLHASSVEFDKHLSSSK